MTFNDWKAYAVNYQDNYQFIPRTGEEEKLSREKRVEIDFWDYVDNQTGDPITIQYASDLDYSTFILDKGDEYDRYYGQKISQPV